MPRPTAAVDLNDLVVAIYDAALHPASWQQCYDGMRSLIGAESMLATLQDVAQGQASLLASNMDPQFLQHYADGWWANDAWAKGVVSQPWRKAQIITDIVSDAEWMGSEIYNDLVRPFANCRFCLGAVVDVDESRAVMGLHRPSGAPDFTVADRRVFQRLLPHIRQSLKMGQRLAEHDNARHTAQAALDALSFGMVVVDSACRPLLMNRMAETCLKQGNGLLGGSARHPLRTESLVQTQSLHRLVRQATAPGLPSPGAMLLRRSASALPLMLLISPLVGRQAALLGISRPAGLIIIQGVDETVPSHQGLRDLFGLTVAEARLAAILARGVRLEEVAEERSVRMSTLRTQLRSILHKTNTDRQAELVQLLTKLSVRTEARE